MTLPNRPPDINFCPPHIRPLAPADAEAYAAVRLRLLRESPDAFITTAAEFAARPLGETAARLAPNVDSVTFGAWVEDDLRGIVTIARETRPRMRHRASVFGFGVLLAARGLGLGNALMDTVLAYARELGVEVVALDVMETQLEAIALYRKLGFEVWGREPDVVRTEDGRRIGALSMRLELSHG